MESHRVFRRIRFLAGAFPLAVLMLLSSSTVANAATARHSPEPATQVCGIGEFCVWPEVDYGGAIARFDLRGTNPEECVPLHDELEARAFANRIDRHVTVYQDRECSTEADFSTYPGPETFVPRSPYIVRAIQIWN